MRAAQGLRLLIERSKTTGRCRLQLLTPDRRCQLSVSLHERSGRQFVMATAYIWPEGHAIPLTSVTDSDDITTLDNILGRLNFKRRKQETMDEAA